MRGRISAGLSPAHGGSSGSVRPARRRGIAYFPGGLCHRSSFEADWSHPFIHTRRYFYVHNQTVRNRPYSFKKSAISVSPTANSVPVRRAGNLPGSPGGVLTIGIHAGGRYRREAPRDRLDNRGIGASGATPDDRGHGGRHRLHIAGIYRSTCSILPAAWFPSYRGAGAAACAEADSRRHRPCRRCRHRQGHPNHDRGHAQGVSDLKDPKHYLFFTTTANGRSGTSSSG